MASISKTSSNNYTSSLYNSANIISGLASGMDTEGMIESLVDSYNTKIQDLTNQATKIEWKQDSYRSIIAKMFAFSNKYTSYTSSNNLASPSFFNNARLVSAQGKYADLVSASGRTDSDVVLNSVDQLATAARYVTGGNLNGGDGVSIQAGDAVDLGADMTMGTLQGSLSLTYGSKNISISFNENDDQYASKEDLVKAIEEKLSKETITFSGGTSAKASERIGVSLDGSGNIVFKEKGSAGNGVYISGASGTVATELGLKGVTSSDKTAEIKLGSGKFTKEVNTAEYLSNKGFNITVDGVTKSIYAPKIEKNEDGTYTFTKPRTVKDANGETKMTYEGGEQIKDVAAGDVAKTYTELLSQSVEKAFGKKVTVSNESADKSKLQLKFQVQEGSDMVVNTSAGEVLGIGTAATSYLNTGKTLGELGVDFSGLTEVKDEDGNVQGYSLTINDAEIGVYNKDTKLSEILNDINSNKEANVKATYSKATQSFVFESKETGENSRIELGDGLASRLFGGEKVPLGDEELKALEGKHVQDFLDKGESLKGKDLGMSVKVGDQDIKLSYSFQGDNPSMKNVLDTINTQLRTNKIDAAASIGKDGELVIQDKDGNKLDVAYEDGSVIKDTFDGVVKQNADRPLAGYTAGQDAKFTVTVNGIKKDMTRSANTVDIDGLSITMKGAFTPAENESPVTFNVTTDSDKIVDAVKSMVSDYNEMMGEIKSAYATLPYQNSSGAFQSYEPLSDEDKAGMSESAIANYEAKAKQGILFGDRDLKGLYEKMYNVFNPSGVDNSTLQKMGLTFSYSSDGTSTLVLDENKLRDMLDSDPDAVADIFTRTSASGGTSGIMEGLKTQLDRYGATTGAVKGILVQQAGTPLSSLSLLDNEWQNQIDRLGTQIEKWQDKLSDRVDYYTGMFSRLEVLINQMNSQSSTLAGMMGG